jgi:hypothetical protein
MLKSDEQEAHIFDKYMHYKKCIINVSGADEESDSVAAALLTVADIIQTYSLTQSFDFMSDLEGMRESLDSMRESIAGIDSKT